MKCKKIIKSLLPHGIIELLNKNNSWEYSGIYQDRMSAKCHASGYEAKNIIKKVFEATQQVIAGKACYERDSYLFYEKKYHYPLISCLYRIAMENNSEVHVLDFGGALGSSFWQNKDMLQGVIKNFSWHIVEQENFYEASQSLVYDAPLFFHRTIEEALNSVKKINVVLLSGVIQYLDELESILKQFENIDYIIIERHPEFIDRTQPVFTVQYVKEPIYDGSYAIKIWGKGELKNALTKNCNLINEWISEVDGTQLFKLRDGSCAEIHSIGMLFKQYH